MSKSTDVSKGWMKNQGCRQFTKQRPHKVARVQRKVKHYQKKRDFSKEVVYRKEVQKFF